MAEMINASSYVRTDEHGAMRVGRGAVLLESVVASFLEGHSAETIQQEYPSLTLEEVYGTIAFYLGHREIVHDYLRRQEKLWEELRRKAEEKPSAVVQRLRGIKAASVVEKS
jgi:hypothetical protein